MPDALEEHSDAHWVYDARPLEQDELRKIRAILRETGPDDLRSFKGWIVELERRKWLWALIRRIGGWTAATTAFIMLFKEYIGKAIRSMLGTT